MIGPTDGGFPIDDLARRMLARESRDFQERLEIEAELIAREERASEIRPRHVARALERTGRIQRPDWLGKVMMVSGGAFASIGAEGFVESWRADHPGDMAFYAALAAVSAIVGAAGLLRRSS